MSKLIDLSHEIEHGTITYPGLPAPAISSHLDYEQSRSHYQGQAEFRIGRMELVANTGTYLDAPSHRFAGRADLAQLALERIVDLEGVVLRAQQQAGRSIAAAHFEGLALGGKAVLIHTGWSRHFGSATYDEAHSFLTRLGAQHLVASGAALVGIDSLNIDDTDDPSRPAHTLLLDAGIPVVEHLTNLKSLPERGFRFFAAPPKIRDFDSFPVRAFAIVA